MGRVYATTAELEAFTGEPAPAGAERLLARASRLVDRAMRSAVYETDASGYPSDDEVLAGFRDAVCAHVADQADRDAEAAELGPWTSVSAGAISMSRPDPGGGDEDAVLTAEAAEILDALNLPRAVWT
ncbi:hypothetical protein ACLIYP_05590 [Streptomyces nanhaiensis]|uniref:hypothetical protein n=1 Tax=Streptomyces nanhaiensis TaxID=679319 RepID=UPI00399CA0E1